VASPEDVSWSTWSEISEGEFYVLLFNPKDGDRFWRSPGKCGGASGSGKQHKMKHTWAQGRDIFPLEKSTYHVAVQWYVWKLNLALYSTILFFFFKILFSFILEKEREHVCAYANRGRGRGRERENLRQTQC